MLQVTTTAYAGAYIYENSSLKFFNHLERCNDVVNGMSNKFLTYDGVELEESLNLNMYEMDFRQYDPAIAKWIIQDPHCTF